MRIFDTRSLKIFVSVCDEKSIEIASHKEGMVRSAASKRITAMEQVIGTKLLERRQRGVAATPAGEIFARRARDILHSMERLNSDLGLYSSSVQGNVTIACALSGVSRDLVADVGAFLGLHDKVHVAILELQIAEVVQAVNSRRADFGLCVEGSHTHLLACLPYRSERLCLVVPDGHPLAGSRVARFRDVLEYELVDVVAGFNGSVVSQLMHREAAALGKPLRSRLQVGSFDAALRAVAEGLGGAVVPAGIAGGHNDLVEVAIDDGWSRREFVLCTREPDDLDTPARLLLDSLALGACRAPRPAGRPMVSCLPG